MQRRVSRIQKSNLAPRRAGYMIRFYITADIKRKRKKVKKKGCGSSFTNSHETISLEGRLWQWHKQSNQSLSISVKVDRGSRLGPLVMLAPCIAFPGLKTTLQLLCNVVAKKSSQLTRTSFYNNLNECSFFVIWH